MVGVRVIVGVRVFDGVAVVLGVGVFVGAGVGRIAVAELQARMVIRNTDKNNQIFF